jgi:hypothetical protein
VFAQARDELGDRHRPETTVPWNAGTPYNR